MIVYLLTTLNYERSAGQEQVLGTCISEGSQPGKRVRADKELGGNSKGKEQGPPIKGQGHKE